MLCDKIISIFCIIFYKAIKVRFFCFAIISASHYKKFNQPLAVLMSFSNESRILQKIDFKKIVKILNIF